MICSNIRDLIVIIFRMVSSTIQYYLIQKVDKQIIFGIEATNLQEAQVYLQVEIFKGN